MFVREGKETGKELEENLREREGGREAVSGRGYRQWVIGGCLFVKGEEIEEREGEKRTWGKEREMASLQEKSGREEGRIRGEQRKRNRKGERLHAVGDAWVCVPEVKETDRGREIVGLQEGRGVWEGRSNREREKE